MVHESGTVTFMVPAPFEKALGLIRQALNERDLGIAAELDISGRISQELGIDLIPCRVLCVDHPQLLQQAIAFDASAERFCRYTLSCREPALAPSFICSARRASIVVASQLEPRRL